MAMAMFFSIGEFSKLSHLTVDALRHYHEVGLLEPARIDPSSGYRQYGSAQLDRARVIRRLRVLDMPLDEVHVVLSAPSEADRHAAIAVHLERMETQLTRTRDVVASLRSLLTEPIQPVEIRYRAIPDALTIAIREPVQRVDTASWCAAAFAELAGAVESLGLDPIGAAAGIFPSEFVSEGHAEITAFQPVLSAAAVGRVTPLLVPGGDFAVATHTGPFSNLDCCYGPMGVALAERGISKNDPFREYYVDTPLGVVDQSEFKTDVCWPVSGLPD